MIPSLLLTFISPSSAGVTCHVAVRVDTDEARIDAIDLETGVRATVAASAPVEVAAVWGLVVEDGKAWLCQSGSLVSISPMAL